MSLHLKRILLLLGSIVISSIILLQGCNRQDSKIKITFAVPGGVEELKAAREVVQAFEKTHPLIRVKIEHIAGGQWEDKVLTQIVGGVGPDVFFVRRDPTPALAIKGALLNLNPYIEKEDYDTGIFFPRNLKSFIWDGKQYALPKTWGVYLLYYNKNLFDKAGIPYPDENWSWEDFREIAQKLTLDDNNDGKIDQYGFSLPGIDVLYPFVYSAGGRLFNKDMTKCIINSPSSIQTLRFFYDLDLKYHLCTTEAFSESTFEGPFLSGKLGMQITWPGHIPSCEKAEKSRGLRWGVEVLPQYQGKRYCRYYADGYAVWAKSKHPEEAWEFLKFLAGPQGARIRAKDATSCPAVKEVAYSKDYLTSPARKKFIEAEQYGLPMPLHPRFREIEKILDNYGELIRFKRLTVAETLTEMEKEINQLLEEEKEEVRYDVK